jgi:lipid A ethanolaminephosphotransferase
MDVATSAYDPKLDLFATCRKTSDTLAQATKKG